MRSYAQDHRLQNDLYKIGLELHRDDDGWTLVRVDEGMMTVEPITSVKDEPFAGREDLSREAIVSQAYLIAQATGVDL